MSDSPSGNKDGLFYGTESEYMQAADKDAHQAQRGKKTGHEKGYLMLVLHGHLPFVRHPEHEEFLEEDWLFEAITETYIPLLRVFDGLVRDQVDFRLCMSLTPTLVSMLRDPLLQERYVRHINKLIAFSELEERRTVRQPALHELARMYQVLFRETREHFITTYRGDLAGAFKKYQDLGKIELITCAATHAFLPLMPDQRAVRAQIMTAVEFHTLHFGRQPRGIWLPECGYYDGLDTVLNEAGIQYFFIDSHGLFHATPRPRYGVYAPVLCPSGVAAFGRDLESSKQVWSSVEGYPGDYDYREFYRDAGFDLDYDYVRPFLHPDGARVGLGIKYHRITGPTNEKAPYVRSRALQKADEHAENFLQSRKAQVQWLTGIFNDRKPLMVAPYDAELFGHWWFEGPQWIDALLRKNARDQEAIGLITPTEYLREYPRCQPATPSPSSWGLEGYSAVWLDRSNDWIYRHLHAAAERMVGLAQTFPEADGLLERALKQAARELMLAQSSDWAFIMKTGSHAEYAIKRTNDHLLRFTRLYNDIRANTVDESWLGAIEYADNIFPDINYRHYA